MPRRPRPPATPGPGGVARPPGGPAPDGGAIASDPALASWANFTLLRAFLALAVVSIAAALVGGAAASAGARAQVGSDGPTGVHVKFAESTAMRLRSGQLVSLTGQDIRALRERVSKHRAQVTRLFGQPEGAIESDLRRLRQSGEDAPDLNLWYRVTVGSEATARVLVAELRSLRALVDEAYLAPALAPPPSGLYTSLQGYVNAAPNGIGARAVSAPGATGSRVEVVDIEYSWNQLHEDLTKAVGALVANGTPDDPFSDTNHGTAVLGELVADDNSFGVTGIVPDAGLSLVNANNSERGYDLANSINNVARTATAPGDVILIEQQAFGPGDGGFVPVEWVGGFYDAIKLATADGRIVVEAAGNGGQNLDNSQLFGKRFPSGKRDSGAIIVGAGAAPGCSSPARSRLFFSTYGERLDLQGWGECVTTTGYGDLFSGDANSLYTSFFNGTSSASPIVAGAAAALSSALEAKTGKPAKPAAMRRILEATGTPQAGNDNIGPLPDLVAAFRRAHLP
jgi:serine protease